jgi:hypothetical protein
VWRSSSRAEPQAAQRPVLTGPPPRASATIGSRRGDAIA